MDCVHEDFAVRRMRRRDVADRGRWKEVTKNSDPTSSGIKLGKEEEDCMFEEI